MILLINGVFIIFIVISVQEGYLKKVRLILMRLEADWVRRLMIVLKVSQKNPWLVYKHWKKLKAGY